jgi:hypothetical protein
MSRINTGDFLHPDQDPRFEPSPSVVVVLLGLDSLLVFLATKSWLFDDARSPRLLLATIVFTLLIGVPFLLQMALLIQFKRRSFERMARPESTFKNVVPSSPGTKDEREISHPSLISIHRIPSYTFRGAPLIVFLNERPVMTIGNASSVEIPVAAGRHEIFVQWSWYKSEILTLDQENRGYTGFECGVKPLITNRFFRFFYRKLFLVGVPVGIAASCFPPFKRFLVDHFVVEFLVIVALGSLALLLNLPKVFSRCPGALLFLAQREEKLDTV